MVLLEVLFGFLVSLFVSAIIVYVATKVLGETEGFGTAISVVFVGAIVFALTSYFIGTGWIATILSGIAWLIIIGNFYNIGWIKSFVVAVVIWFFTNVVRMVLYG